MTVCDVLFICNRELNLACIATLIVSSPPAPQTSARYDDSGINENENEVFSHAHDRIKWPGARAVERSFAAEYHGKGCRRSAVRQRRIACYCKKIDLNLV